MNPSVKKTQKAFKLMHTPVASILVVFFLFLSTVGPFVFSHNDAVTQHSLASSSEMQHSLMSRTDHDDSHMPNTVTDNLATGKHHHSMSNPHCASFYCVSGNLPTSFYSASLRNLPFVAVVTYPSDTSYRSIDLSLPYIPPIAVI